jgi:putative FmdB family regulatory protein
VAGRLQATSQRHAAAARRSRLRGARGLPIRPASAPCGEPLALRRVGDRPQAVRASALGSRGPDGAFYTGRNMPIYEYRCENGHTFEVLRKMTDDPIKVCETCEQPVEQVFHPITVHFKGKGFYNTDYGTKKRAREVESNASSKKADKAASSNGDTKSEAKSEAKSETKSESKSTAASDSKAKPAAPKKSE